jgi:O-antigen biosynthesis protein
MEKTLKNLFLDHEGKLSDKWEFYLNEWDEILFPYRDTAINILEIGIHNGGSLEIWGKYFPKAKNILGCDIDEACSNLNYEDPRISVLIGDVNTHKIEQSIIETATDFDIIIDDGSHQSGDIIQSFERYFKHLNNNGVYIIEDLHASYWDAFEGGLFYPYSAMAFLKRLADITNFEHWRNNQSRKEFLHQFEKKYHVDFDEFVLCGVHSVKFLNSLCIIQKRPPVDNALGKRFIVGTEEIVSENWNTLNGITIHDIATPIHNDLELDVFSLLSENKSLKEAKKELESTKQQLEAEVLFYALSKSWRITRPLRKITRFLKEKLHA